MNGLHCYLCRAETRMPGIQKYKLQIDTLCNKAMLRINSGAPVGINQNSDVISRLLYIRQPRLVAVRRAQMEQWLPHEAAEVSLLNQVRQGAENYRWKRNRTIIRRSALNCRDRALLGIASFYVC